MSYHHFYKQLDEKARKLFPSLREIPEISWDYLISPLELRLPKAVKANAQAAITALWELSRRESYQSLLPEVPGVSGAEAKNQSVLMAYDFHTSEDGTCSLVEVNTNAAGYMLGSIMEMTHANNETFGPLDELFASFENELRLVRKPTAKARVAITDENINEQKMLPEFLIYRDWFATRGWSAELCEATDFLCEDGRLVTRRQNTIDLVYNRLTDFYFEDPAHSGMSEGYLTGAAVISPNPREYWLLADKQRMIEWGEPGFLEKAGASAEEAESLRKVLIPSFDKSSFASEDDIWAERKHLFFKPKRSHGGKSVYRGESVSRKVFERLMSEDIIIQRYHPPQKMPTEDPRSVLSNWKFDVRFFVYGDRIQLTVARIYQGQVTNFASPMGGFTAVRFT